MTTHDFWMLGTGAVIPFAFTGTAKWIFRLFDAVVPVSQVPDQLKVVLSVKANRSLFWTSLLCLLQIVCIIGFALDKSPITRLSILFGALLLIFLLLIFHMFLWELVSRSISSQRRRAKIEAEAESTDQTTVTG
jgi:hypothetical protein